VTRAVVCACAHSTRSEPESAVVRCAAFDLGDAGSTGCPASYRRLDTETACASAAGVGGKLFGDTGEYSYYPAGCFWHSVTGSVYYNTDPTNTANHYAQPLCASATRFPPPGVCMHSGVCGAPKT
jgi:hypothetical protein